MVVVVVGRLVRSPYIVIQRTLCLGCEGPGIADPFRVACESRRVESGTRDTQSTILSAQEWLEETESDTALTDRKAIEAAATREQALSVDSVTNNGDSSSSAAAGPAESPPKLPSYAPNYPSAPTSTSTSPELDGAHKPASHRVNRA